MTGTKLNDSCPTTPAGGTSYTHDAAGNNTTLGSASYNTRNQATNIDGLAMGYLDLGNDQRTSVGSTTMADGPLGITGQKIGTTVTWYTRMPDGLLLDSREVSGATQVYFTEPHSKSVAALFSTAGALNATYLYSPYEETTVYTGGSGGVGDKNPFRYVFGWQDGGANNFYKLGARYDDGRGHFTQPDPIAGSIYEPMTLSGFHYSAGEPINKYDPTGLLWGWVARKVVRKVAPMVRTALAAAESCTETVSSCVGNSLLLGLSAVSTVASGVGIVVAAPATLGGSLLLTGGFVASMAGTAAALRMTTEAC